MQFHLQLVSQWYIHVALQVAEKIASDVTALVLWLIRRLFFTVRVALLLMQLKLLYVF